jgi:hypothetical protein
MMKSKMLTSILGGALTLGSLGCTQLLKQRDASYSGPFHTVANVYISPEGLPANLQRIAVMPLMPGRGNRSAQRGVPLIQQAFTEELSRARVFDVVTLTPNRLDTLVGVQALYADSRLPIEFISKIKEETGCQAVLFAELTTFRAYPPVAVGWKLHLFDLETEELVWAADEVFDAGRAAVANALRRHIREKLSPNSAAATQLLVLDSPREMTRFSLGELIGTFTQKNPKVTLKSADNTNSQSNFERPEEASEKPDPVEADSPENQKNPAPPTTDSNTI